MYLTNKTSSPGPSKQFLAFSFKLSSVFRILIDREQFVFEKKSSLDLGVFRMAVAEKTCQDQVVEKKNYLQNEVKGRGAE